MLTSKLKSCTAVIAFLSLSCQSFIIPPHQRTTTIQSFHSRTLKLFSYSQALKRRNVQLPLLDIQDDESIIIPLPAAHLPDELTTMQIYGVQLNSAIHKMMIQDTVSKIDVLSPGELLGSRAEPMYGHIVSKSEDGSLVGGIGCAAEIVVATPSNEMQIQTISDDSELAVKADFDEEAGGEDMLVGSGEEPMTVLAKGSFRFVVKEVVQSFPYPIAIVDELLDEEPVESAPIEYNDFEDTYENEDDDDDDDEDYIYNSIDSSELIPRTLRTMKAIVDQKLSSKPKAMTPLEEQILKESGIEGGMDKNIIERNQAEEMAAIFEIFISSLIDIAPNRIDRLFAVGMLAAEFSDLDNSARNQVITTLDGVARLRLVLKYAEKKVSMVAAKKITEEIVDQSDEDSKDLKVGTPSLPPWAKQIRKGTKLEYYWNEAEGWCKGEVAEDPVMVVDELIITVLFEDGETVKLPFQGDEKARWRPGGMSD